MEPSNLIGGFLFLRQEKKFCLSIILRYPPSSTIKSESIYEKEFIYYLFFIST